MKQARDGTGPSLSRPRSRLGMCGLGSRPGMEPAMVEACPVLWCCLPHPRPPLPPAPIHPDLYGRTRQ
jgi:hypothetical protein